jgi:cytochrome P450
MFAESVLVLMSFLLFLLFQTKTNRRNYLFSKIPSPKKYFLLHNLPEVFGLDQSELFKKFQYFNSKLGDVAHVTFHPLDCGIVLVTDHEIAKTLSNSQSDRTRSMIYEFLAGWIGSDGAFLSSGNQQREKLKLLKHGMTPKFHEKYLKIATLHFEQAVKDLKANKIKQIEFSSWISNVILDISFGKKLIYQT